MGANGRSRATSSRRGQWRRGSRAGEELCSRETWQTLAESDKQEYPKQVKYHIDPTHSWYDVMKMTLYLYGVPPPNS